MKHFLDSVHGTINIPQEYCDKIIDTCYFQRLRRIEQNSCRSVFPSARHDRFIHSIGVFHLGSLIVENIKNKCKTNLPENNEVIFTTYKMACLLHDIGHTPFSHTFEEYFNLEEVEKSLKRELNDKAFNIDTNKNEKAAHHEAISAYLSVKVFRDTLLEFGVDLVLLARMITGYKYFEGEKPISSFENAMIELIHGDIIDADGLDYVCRDVWAGGYKNFSIDLNRLINSIEIIGDQNKEYKVVYSSKALNEIETVLNIKNFQYIYVIKHHKVLLEQYILVEAMKSAACYHLQLPSGTMDERDNALRTLCDFNMFSTPKILPESNYKLCRPVDDDFVALMKQYDLDNKYISQWFSRQYETTPLWKSKMEYFNTFSSVFKTLSEDSIMHMNTLLTSDECKHFLCTMFNLAEDDIIIINVKPKYRKLNEKKINIKLHNIIKPYSDLSHDMFSIIGKEISFCYIYVNTKTIDKEDIHNHKKEIISKLKDFLINGLRDKWNKS